MTKSSAARFAGRSFLSRHLAEASPEGGTLSRLLRHLELEPACLGDPRRRIEDLQRDQVSTLIVVQNNARLVFIALGDHGTRLEDNAERIGSSVIGRFHGSCLQYFATRLVR